MSEDARTNEKVFGAVLDLALRLSPRTYAEELASSIFLAKVATSVPVSEKTHDAARAYVESYAIPPAVYRLYASAILNLYSLMHDGQSRLGKFLDECVAADQWTESSRGQLLTRMDAWMWAAYLDLQSMAGNQSTVDVLPPIERSDGKDSEASFDGRAIILHERNTLHNRLTAFGAGHILGTWHDVAHEFGHWAVVNNSNIPLSNSLMRQFNAFAGYQQTHMYVEHTEEMKEQYRTQISERAARLFEMVLSDTANAYVSEKTAFRSPDYALHQARGILTDMLENADKAHARDIERANGDARLARLSGLRAIKMRQNAAHGLNMMRGKRKVIWGSQDKIADVFARCSKLMMTPEHIADGDSKLFLTPHVYACKWRNIKRHMGG